MTKTASELWNDPVIAKYRDPKTFDFDWDLWVRDFWEEKGFKVTSTEMKELIYLDPEGCMIFTVDFGDVNYGEDHTLEFEKIADHIHLYVSESGYNGLRIMLGDTKIIILFFYVG